MSGIMMQLLGGGAGGAAVGLNVENIFRTNIWSMNGDSVTNDIDLSTEGGMVWVKSITQSQSNLLFDTERGAGKDLNSDDNSAEDNSGRLSSFNSDGFTVATDAASATAGQRHVGWTFRRAAGFFDVVKYTGNGTNGRTISHSLGTTVGCIIIKNYSSENNWIVYHRGANSGSSPEDYYGRLDLNNAFADGDTYFNDTAPTSSVFSVGTDYGVNNNGQSYVAYIFAHNNSDGGFGESKDQDIIKCGYYDGGAASNVDVNVGFEPQFLLIKGYNESSDFQIYDQMRGIHHGDINDHYLKVSTTDAESEAERLEITPTGFRTISNNNDTNAFGGKYVYIAIRRPMAIPTTATDVFYVKDGTADYTAAFPADLLISTRTSSSPNYVFNRFTGSRYLLTNASTAEADAGSGMTKIFQDDTGVSIAGPWWGASLTNTVGWLWRRAPNYFDMIAYTGNGTAGRSITHNLGVAPEMMWVKSRSGSYDWKVYHKDVGTIDDNGNDPSGYNFTLNENFALDYDGGSRWNADPTSSVFKVGSHNTVNKNNDYYIAMLFCSLDGIAKVGSYTGNGSNQTIDCGFSAGARFIMVKAATQAGSWLTWSTATGITSTGDNALSFDTTNAEVSNDYVDSDNSGFIINAVHGSTDTYNPNSDGVSYIFYAIA